MTALSPSEREAIFDAYEAGENSHVIAARYKVHPAYVRTLFRRMGGDKRAASKRRKTARVGPPPVRVHLPDLVSKALTEAADKREITLPKLIATMLDAVVADGLIDAVLDDGVARSAERDLPCPYRGLKGRAA